MLTGSPKLARREQAIDAARRRLRRLEIEQHRIKAALARLEADYEDDVADWLSRKLRRREPTPAGAVEHDERSTGAKRRPAEAGSPNELESVRGSEAGVFAAALAVDLDPRGVRRYLISRV